MSQAVFRQFSESRHTGFLEGPADWRCDASLLLARGRQAVMVAFFQSELEACLAPRAALRASSTGQQRAKLFVLTRELRCGTSSSWGGHYIRADFYLITVTVSCRSDKQIPKLHQQPSEHWGSFPLWKSDCCNVFTQPEDCPSSPHHFMMGMSSMNRRKHPQCPVSSFQWKNDRKYPVLPVRPPPLVSHVTYWSSSKTFK